MLPTGCLIRCIIPELHVQRPVPQLPRAQCKGGESALPTRMQVALASAGNAAPELFRLAAEQAVTAWNRRKWLGSKQHVANCEVTETPEGPLVSRFEDLRFQSSCFGPPLDLGNAGNTSNVILGRIPGAQLQCDEFNSSKSCTDVRILCSDLAHLADIRCRRHQNGPMHNALSVQGWR